MGKVRWFESSRRYGHDPENDTVYFNDCLRSEYGLHIETGRFGADMKVDFINDGPVTILLDTDEL